MNNRLGCDNYCQRRRWGIYYKSIKHANKKIIDHIVFFISLFPLRNRMICLYMNIQVENGNHHDNRNIFFLLRRFLWNGDRSKYEKISTSYSRNESLLFFHRLTCYHLNMLFRSYRDKSISRRPDWKKQSRREFWLWPDFAFSSLYSISSLLCRQTLSQPGTDVSAIQYLIKDL